MTDENRRKPQRNMMIGVLAGLVLAAVLVSFFYNRVQQRVTAPIAAQR